jgi:hypothetical protein
VSLRSTLRFFVATGLALAAANGQQPWLEDPFPTVILSHRSQVTVDVLMATVPDSAALALLPKLREPATFLHAETELLRLIANKQARLISWPELTFHDRERAVSESILEQRFPSEIELPTDPNHWGVPVVSPEKKILNTIAAAGGTTPHAFETRNLGVAFSAEAVVSADRQSATLSVAAHYVRIHRFEAFRFTAPKDVPQLAISQPLFGTSKISAYLTMRHNERRLIHVGKSSETPDRLELFIIGLRIVPPITPVRQ